MCASAISPLEALDKSSLADVLQVTLEQRPTGIHSVSLKASADNLLDILYQLVSNSALCWPIELGS